MGILMVGMVDPEIDRHISKKWKKTKLPGNNSWKVLIWLFILCEWLFSGKIHFATLSNVQITIFYCFQTISQGAWWFFLHLNIQNVLYQILSEGFLHLTSIYTKKKEIFDFNFWKHVSLCFVFVNHVRFFLPISAIGPYSKTEQSNI